MTTPPYRDIWQLFADTPRLGRGWTEPVRPANPAAGAGVVHVVPANAWERVKVVTFQLVTSAAAGGRLPVINYTDADGFLWDQVLAGDTLGPSETGVTFMNNHTPTAAAAGPGSPASGQVTGPAAGAVIATTGALAAGRYTVTGQIMLTGTTAAADAANMQLQVGATVIQVLRINSVAGSTWPVGPVTVDVPAGTAITINAVALGTGTAVYSADFQAVPAAGFTYYGQLPPFLLRQGWTVTVTATGLLAGDQFSAAGFLVDRFPSDYAGGTTARDEDLAERAALASLMPAG